MNVEIKQSAVSSSAAPVRAPVPPAPPPPPPLLPSSNMLQKKHPMSHSLTCDAQNRSRLLMDICKGTTLKKISVGGKNNIEQNCKQDVSELAF